MMKNCQSLATEVKGAAKKRKEPSADMFVLKAADMEADTYHLHSIYITHAKFDALKQLLPDDFLMGIMGRATNGGSQNYITKRSTENAISYLVIPTLVKGKQEKQSLVEALKEGVAELKKTNPKFK
eukprot:7431829-Ditylum_brightwellii.AAC.1